MTKTKIFKSFIVFIQKQIRREFFGFIGLIGSLSILSYGVIFRDSKIQTSSLSATGFKEVVFSIPVYIIGIILILIFLSYLYFKRK